MEAGHGPGTTDLPGAFSRPVLLLGHPTPNALDPTGKRFGFEMGVAKTSEGQGWE
jgi:hypothetical protein